jgi:hypothetical protein
VQTLPVPASAAEAMDQVLSGVFVQLAFLSRRLG